MIDEKIREIERYFIDKMINKDYQIVEIKQYSVLIKIDNKYNFNLWVADGIHFLDCHSNNSSENFMNLSFEEKEQTKIYNNLHHIYEIEIQKEIKKEQVYCM